VNFLWTTKERLLAFAEIVKLTDTKIAASTGLDPYEQLKQNKKMIREIVKAWVAPAQPKSL